MVYRSDLSRSILAPDPPALNSAEERIALAPIVNSVCLAWDPACCPPFDVPGRICDRAARRGAGGARRGLLAHRIAASPRRGPLEAVSGVCRSSCARPIVVFPRVFWEITTIGPRSFPTVGFPLPDCWIPASRLVMGHSRHLASGLTAGRVTCGLNHIASHYTSQGTRPTPQRAPCACLAVCGFVQPPLIIGQL